MAFKERFQWQDSQLVGVLAGGTWGGGLGSGNGWCWLGPSGSADGGFGVGSMALPPVCGGPAADMSWVGSCSVLVSAALLPLELSNF